MSSATTQAVKSLAIAITACFVRFFEGKRLVGYLCPAGIPTNGYGSTGPDVKVGERWTEEYAEERMQRDVQTFWAGTVRLCPQLDTGPKQAAITDFAYNLGLTRLAGSTLRRKIRARDWQGAAGELRKWRRGGGRVLPGLVRRREFEVRILLGEDYK